MASKRVGDLEIDSPDRWFNVRLIRHHNSAVKTEITISGEDLDDLAYLVAYCRKQRFEEWRRLNPDTMLPVSIDWP